MNGSRIQDAVETFRVPADTPLPHVVAYEAFRVPEEDHVITIVADDNVIVIEV